MLSRIVFLLLGVSLGLWGTAIAENTSPRKESQFEAFKGDGYYWYKQDPEEGPKPAPKVAVPNPVVAAPAKEPLKALSTEWMRTNMPKLLDAAVDNPTTENVANYMYAQRVLLDKSQNFSEKVKEVVSSDPFLDENNRVPIAQFAQAGFSRNTKAGQDEVLSFLGGKGGLWVFIDEPEKCSACADYAHNILEGNKSAPGIATQFKFDYRKINVSTPAGKAAAKRLKLTVTPTTVLVIPPAGFFLVSQGLMSQTQLSERLLIAAKTSGILTKELEEKVNPYAKGVLTTDEISGAIPSNDPFEVMKSLRQRIKVEK
jgi:conjugal transfer pilus assembly protein TraF